MYDDIVNLGESEGIAGHLATMIGTITYDGLAELDITAAYRRKRRLRTTEHGGLLRPPLLLVNIFNLEYS
jgi:hypothetical protein